MKPWLIRRKLLLAQLADLQRQLQEAWDERDKWKAGFQDRHDYAGSLLEQLHRVARERDECYRQRRLADIRRQKLILSQLEEDNG